MPFLKNLPMISNTLTIAILGVVAVGIAIALNFMAGDDSDLAGSLSSPPSNEQAFDDTTDPPATPDGSVATDGLADVSGEGIIAPSFDVVRVNPGGGTVIAGRAESGALVEIYNDDRAIGRVTTDERGEWVFVPDQPLEVGNRQLSLRSQGANGKWVSSDQVVMVAVPDDETGEAVALVIATPADGSAGASVLQKPGGQATTVLGVNAMDYDSRGGINLSGTATPGSSLNIYIDDNYIGTAETDESGQWRLAPEKAIEPGWYELRVDQVDDGGKVENRVAMPFVREEITGTLEPGTFYVVQPGNSLWRIARRAYGRGERFTLIFEANTNQIRDPDLIFPGQIFALPEE